MLGNVGEWVDGCYSETYSGAPSDGSAETGAEDCRRVVRGGSWSGRAADIRAASRDNRFAFDRVDDRGFRVARTLAP